MTLRLLSRNKLHFEASAVAPLRLGCYSKTLTPVVVATEPSHFAFSFANAGPTQCELIHPPNWRVHEAASGGRPKASGSIRRARISRATGGSPPISPSGGLGSARARLRPRLRSRGNSRTVLLDTQCTPEHES